MSPQYGDWPIPGPGTPIAPEPGWRSLPQHMAEQDLADGLLIALQLKAHPLLGTVFSMHAIWRKVPPPGPAGSWFEDRLKSDPV
jgi:DNA-binding transcriptional LysR family regulator